VVAQVAGVGIRAPLEQEVEGVRVADRQVEPGGTLGVACPDEPGITVQQVAQGGDVARGAGGKECFEHGSFDRGYPSARNARTGSTRTADRDGMRLASAATATSAAATTAMVTGSVGLTW
jgi:hypothetical protein